MSELAFWTCLQQELALTTIYSKNSELFARFFRELHINIRKCFVLFHGKLMLILKMEQRDEGVYFVFSAWFGREQAGER